MLVSSALAPAPSYYNETPRLKFVHITKTGGSSIEQMGVEAGIVWALGRMQILSMQKSIGCFSCEKSQWECSDKKSQWHCPPLKYRSGIGIGAYNNSKTFAVVCNPYDRIISKYYWEVKTRKYNKSENQEI